MHWQGPLCLDKLLHALLRLTVSVEAASCTVKAHHVEDALCMLQGLDDHAHKPTLERLPKDKLVVGSPAAAAVAQELGYTNVKSVDHGQLVSICDGQIEIEATAGK